MYVLFEFVILTPRADEVMGNVFAPVVPAEMYERLTLFEFDIKIGACPIELIVVRLIFEYARLAIFTRLNQIPYWKPVTLQLVTVEFAAL